MSNPASSPVVADQPMPSILVGKFGGWATQAQKYPTFSPTWFKYKALSYRAPLAFIAALLAGVVFLVPTDVVGQDLNSLVLLMAGFWLSICAMFLLGRWLAVQVCKRGWAARKETMGVALALILGAGVSGMINHVCDKSFGSHRDRNVTIGVGISDKKADSGADEGKKVDRSAPVSGLKHKRTTSEVVFNAVFWIGLCIWLGGGLDFLAFIRQRRELQHARIQEELNRAHAERNKAELQLSVLAAQIEPHFLFNTLSGVRSAIISDPARGIAIIDHLVDYLRATIPQMRSDGGCSQARLAAQLDAARAYLGVMHARMPRLNYSVECDPELFDASVPPLMLISLVENAIKHGIEPKAGQARIDVLAKKVSLLEGERIELTVMDDGAGFGGATSGSGIGLSNIRERLSQLYGKDAALILKSRPEGGVMATISLPLIRKEKAS